MSLKRRIDTFKERHPKEEKKLTAIRWIGNTASYSVNNLNKDKVLDAFLILEYVLKSLYDKSGHRIEGDHSGSQTYNFTTTSLASGMYIIHISTSNETINKRLIVN